jgi:hypothetical protein
LECILLDQREKGGTNKLTKSLQITGIIIKAVKPSKVQKQTRLGIHNTSAVRTLLYDSETWTLKEQDKSRITAAEMNFFWETAPYTPLNHKINQYTSKEVKSSIWGRN